MLDINLKDDKTKFVVLVKYTIYTLCRYQVKAEFTCPKIIKISFYLPWFSIRMSTYWRRCPRSSIWIFNWTWIWGRNLSWGRRQWLSASALRHSTFGLGRWWWWRTRWTTTGWRWTTWGWTTRGWTWTCTWGLRRFSDRLKIFKCYTKLSKSFWETQGIKILLTLYLTLLLP